MNKLRKIWQDRFNQVEYIKWLIKYTKPFAGRISLIFSLNLIVTVLTLVMAVVTKQIIDNAMIGDQFIGLIVIYLVITIVVQGSSIFITLFTTMLDEKFSFGIRKQVYEKIINAHWMDVKQYHTGDLMTRLTSDAGNISEGIVHTIPSIVQLMVELILVFFTLFYYSPMLAIFALVMAPFASVLAWWLGKKLRVLQLKVQETESKYRSFLQESLANLLIVKAFANEDYSVRRLTILRDDRFSWIFKRTKMSVASSTVMGVTFQLGYIVAFAYGALQISVGAITYGTMSIFLTLVNRVQSPVMELAKQVPKIVSILASAERIIEIQNIVNEEKNKINISTHQIGVDIDNLTFGYSDEVILENVSLQIKPGEFVAIVGESGIGKTTLVRLIMSFMNNVKGNISFVNSQGERENANAKTREFIAYVPQGNTLFSGTIKENILMGNLQATDEEIIVALKLSAAYDFVSELPKGMNTIIGERGHGISEGQAQRIAIARAFVRKAPFLILDEATSSLDENTELEVVRGLQLLKPKPTCLVITHRKSILEYCDREIKIENKKTSEI